MPKLAANLSMLFTEHPFMERFSAAAHAGFSGVEYLFPYAFDADEIAATLQENGLTQALFNLPPGDWQQGERGLACLPGREAEFSDSVDQALRYAQRLNCTRLHMMAGLGRADDTATQKTYLHNLCVAAEAAHANGIKLLIEPINPIDMPGYFLNTAEQAAELIRQAKAAGAPHAIFIQLDLYHRQMTQGRLFDAIHAHLDHTAHIQIAGVPHRHEPNQNGEVNWSQLLEHLDKSGYDGWVGCEYHPAGDTQAGLKWATAWLKQPTQEGVI